MPAFFAFCALSPSVKAPVWRASLCVAFLASTFAGDIVIACFGPTIHFGSPARIADQA
ncbi:hypothetical protein NKJ06_34750 [Mesorhizobium sp. M0293]|uniref:hypothetical protein n=1 Tax=unclassified Mesorhizobium TaxID=325217 RepID=UPI003339D9A2